MTYAITRCGFKQCLQKIIQSYNPFHSKYYCNTNFYPNELIVNEPKKIDSVLDITNEDVSDYAPNLGLSQSLAAFVNKSYSLQQFLKLGVDLNKIEKKGFSELILRCDFERDVKKYILFLHDVGVPASELGNFFTKNPSILKENLNNLAVRINYLQAKKFLPDGIVRILTKNPQWISHSAEDIDDRLGFFQLQFQLNGDEVRQTAIKMPKLITSNLRHVETIKFTVQEEMGFNVEESKQMLLQTPKIFTLNRIAIRERLHFLLNVIKIPHEKVSLQPSVLLSRVERIKVRHQFLQLLKKTQYDPTKPGYISLEALARGDDVAFCKNVADTSVLTFNSFLKTL